MVRIKREKKENTPWKGWAASALLLAGILFLFAAGSSRMAEGAGEKGEETLLRAIARASVQCYAIEGRYPPSVEYMETYYGVKVDHDRYAVFYDGFASNVMPDITVVFLGEDEGT